MKMKKAPLTGKTVVGLVTGPPAETAFFDGKPDKEVWLMFKDGHEGAFTWLYENYFDPLYNFGLKGGFSVEAVEDCLQDLFVELRQRRARLGEVLNVKAYLFKCFRRKLLRDARKSRVLELVGGQRSGISFEPVIEQEEHFVDARLSALQQQHLQKALATLPVRQREAIYHFFYEGFSYTELAEVMELGSAKTARNLVYKSLASLRAQKDKLPHWLVASLLLALSL